MSVDLRNRLAALSPEQRRVFEARLAGRSDRARPTVGAPAVGAGMRQSLFFFSAETSDDAAAKYALVLDCARFADTHDFDAVWMPERHFDPFGGPYPNPAVLAAALSTVTRRVELRAGSVVLPLQDPLRVAEDWAMLDNLSNGRIGLAFASGWHADDFVLAPERYAVRKDVLLSNYRAFAALWRGEAIERTNGSAVTVPIRTFPRPRQTLPPLWLTSSVNKATWDTAAELGLNVLTGLLEQSVDELEAKISAYRERLAALGHDPSTRRVSLMLHTFVGADASTVRSHVAAPLKRYLRQHIDLFEKLARSQNLGIDPSRVGEADKAALVDFAFERYFHQSGVFGTPESCVPFVERLSRIGVDELAHLIDFGVPSQVVLDHLGYLNQLRERLAASSRAPTDRALATHTV